VDDQSTKHGMVAHSWRREKSTELISPVQAPLETFSSSGQYIKPTLYDRLT
jgi:hypothetical protein